MATTKTEDLLRLTPEDALSLMVTNANELKYPVYGLKAGAPELTGFDAKETKVRLTARDRVAKDDHYPYIGSFDFTMRRLHLQDYLQGELLGYRPVLPCSTQTLLDEITARLGLEFYIDDVVHEEIGRSNSQPYILKAKRESLRWVGTVEFYLSDVRDLSEAITETDLGATQYTKFVAEPPTSMPYAMLPNLYQSKLQAMSLNVRAQEDGGKMLDLFRYSVPGFDLGLDPANPLWSVSATPKPFNLYNAVMINGGISTVPQPVGINPALTKAALIRLDPAYCTNVSDPLVYIWYAPLNTIARDLSTQPRLIQSGTLVTLDGTSYSTWLSSLKVTEVIDETPHPSMALDGTDYPGWTVSNTKGPTNLKGAVVQYNGFRRGQDNLHVNPNLTHLIILTINEQYNSLWRGNIAIYYRLGTTNPNPGTPPGFVMKAYTGSKANGSVTLNEIAAPTWTGVNNPDVGSSAAQRDGKVTLNGANYLTAELNAALNIGSGDFTLEFYVTPTANTDQLYSILSARNGAIGDGETAIVFMQGAIPGQDPAAAGRVTCVMTNPNGLLSQIASLNGLRLNQRTKVALYRVGDDMYISMDDRQAGWSPGWTDVDFKFSRAAGSLLGGSIAPGAGLSHFNGVIDDVRVVKGVSLYEPAPVVSFDRRASPMRVTEGATTEFELVLDRSFTRATTVPLDFTFGDAVYGTDFSLTTGASSVLVPPGVLRHTFGITGIVQPGRNPYTYMRMAVAPGLGYRISSEVGYLEGAVWPATPQA